MTSRVVNLRAEPNLGDSVLIEGRPYVVLDRLPRLPGRPPAARVTPDLPCRFCEEPLLYNGTRSSLEPGQPEEALWWCSSCRRVYYPWDLAPHGARGNGVVRDFASDTADTCRI